MPGPTRPKIMRIVIVPTFQIGGSRSLPATVGPTVPQIPIRDPTPREHPQSMTTATGASVGPLVPGNSSILALEYPLELVPESPEALPSAKAGSAES